MASENLEEIEDEIEHEHLICDILYLHYEHPSFNIPKKISFKKDESMVTASLVAMIPEKIMPDELNYWTKYMSDEDK